MAESERPNTIEPANDEATGQPRVGRRVVTAAMSTLALAACADDAEPEASGGGGAGGGSTASTSATSASSTQAVGSTGASGSPVAQASVGTGGQGGAGDGGAGPAGSGGGDGSGGDGSGGGGGGTPADACTATSDLSPQELLASIDTFVVLCMENRSFDHFLGSLKLVEGRGDVLGLDGTESNPDGQGGEVGVYLLEDFTPDDPPHGWDAAHAQFDGGLNDGFVTEYGGTAVMGYHVREQIPITYALADASAICDHYHASVMGPTWPNRFYLHGATSKGQKGNSPVFGFDPIWDVLDAANLSGTNYFHDVAWATGAYFKFSGNAGIEDFFDDAAAGTLPNFAIIDPQFFGNGANDDHPDHHIFLGQALIASVYQAMANSPQWGRCMLIITYDEHGGFHDHVPPPAAVDDDGDFTQHGFRVPTLVTGPFVRRGCAVSTLFDHTSILKTLAVRWGLPTLSARMEAAEDLSSCIDPNALGRPHAPVVLPQVPVPVDAIFAAPSDPKARPLHHQEMWDAAERGDIPPHLDRRADGDRIARQVLEVGERLGAVKRVRGR